MTLLMDNMNIPRAWTFFRVHSVQSTRGGKIHYTDVPSKKNSLIEQCAAFKDELYTLHICVEPFYHVFLEPGV